MPVYNLFVKYETVTPVPADARMPLATKLTRDGVPVRAVTVRAAVPRIVVLPYVARDATLRDVPPIFLTEPSDERTETLRVLTEREFVPRVVAAFGIAVARVDAGRAVVARDVVPRVAVPRVAVARDAFVVRAVAVLRAEFTRAVVGIAVGAIGSAKTVRIDNNVEQIKNAPASKNIVPTAFLYASVIFLCVM